MAGRIKAGLDIRWLCDGAAFYFTRGEPAADRGAGGAAVLADEVRLPLGSLPLGPLLFFEWLPGRQEHSHQKGQYDNNQQQMP